MNIMDLVNKPAPETLFHYSDFTGLNGIVFNNEIWLGDMFFLNDEKEYLLGISVFNEELESYKVKYKNYPFGIFLRSMDGIEVLLKGQSPLSFSLTEEDDLLSQWRGYTNNNNKDRHNLKKPLNNKDRHNLKKPLRKI